MDDATLRIELADEGGPDLRQNPDLDAAMGFVPPTAPKVGAPPTTAAQAATGREDAGKQTTHLQELAALARSQNTLLEEILQQLSGAPSRRPKTAKEKAEEESSAAKFQKGFLASPPGTTPGPALGRGVAELIPATAFTAVADKIADTIGSAVLKYAPTIARAGASTSVTAAEAANGIMGEEMLKFAEQIPILGGFAKALRGAIEATTAALQQGAKEIRFAGQQLANRISLNPLQEQIDAVEKRVKELREIDTFATRQQAARIERDQLAPLQARQRVEAVLQQRSEALRRFSPEASAAFAQARVTDLMTAQRQAADLGPRMAEFFRIQAALRESQQARQQAQVNADLFRQIEQTRLEDAVNRMAVAFEDSKIRLEASDALAERDRGRAERYQKFIARYTYLIHQEAQKAAKRDQRPPFEKQLDDLKKGLDAAERGGRGVNDLPDPAPFNVPAFRGF